MQKKVLFLVFAALLICVLGLLFFLMGSSDIQGSVYRKNDKELQDKNSNLAFAKKSWIKKLSSYKKDDYLFPVTELFLTMKFAKQKKVSIQKKEKERYYTLVIPDLNNYSLFCILQILNGKKVPYIIENGYENSKIFVKAYEKSNLEEISNELKKYDIVPIIQSR